MKRSNHVLFATLLAAAALAAALPVPASRADELRAAIRGNGIVIHDATETLRDFCHWSADGKLRFAAPGGLSWELVTSVADPAIGNPGDGEFHPFDAAEVRSAIAGVRFPLARVSAEVFLLPYPRRAGVESAAGPGLILLSPGVRAIAAEQQHAETTHELGHLVQYALMPDSDTLAWSRYRRLRGIQDEFTYSAASAHVDRPHEIFAEDFRALFGNTLANYSGTIENSKLSNPVAVLGLEAMMLSLVDAPAREGDITIVDARPHGAVVLARNGSSSSELDLFDVAGRRIASVLPTADASGCHWSWDGRDRTGARVITSVLFARARDGKGGVARLVHVR